MSIVLQYELLKIKHGSLMVDSLPQLDLSLPGVRGPHLLAIIALFVAYLEFNYVGLLKDGAFVDLFLNIQFNFNSLRMGFCPNKAGIKHFYTF